MTSKKFLSNKKTTQQTISISPSLKEWIVRYVSVNSKKNPKDERFKSISAFYNHVLENIMELFRKGKTLDDFERVEDKEVKDFFDDFSFNATVPLYEMTTENDRFAPFSFKNFTRFLLFYLKFLKKNFSVKNYDELQILFDKIRTRVNPSPISKEMSLEIFPDEKRNLATATLEFIGKLIDDNNLNFDGEISQGQVLEIDKVQNGNEDIKDFYELKKKHPQNFYNFKNDIPPFSFDNDIIRWDTTLHSFDSIQL